MNNDTKETAMEDVNNDLHLTIARNLLFPLNEIVAWAIFGDSTFLVPEESLIYSNYADLSLDTDIINSKHLELMNNIEQDIKQQIDKNADNVDFSTRDSANKDIKKILDDFLPRKYKELGILVFKKNTRFKGAPIWWAALVIAYREVAFFAFKNGSYYVAIQLHEFCKDCQAQMMFKNVAFDKDHKNKLSGINRAGGLALWGDSVENQRRRYLELDEQYQKDTGEKLKIKAMAWLIYNQGNNEFNMGFETIRDHLSKARREIFTNKKKDRR